MSSYACEICGCGVGNFYVGLLPQFKNKFIGVRYHYTQYHSVMASDATQFSRDYFKTAEIWGGINLGKKWQVLAFIPYNFNKQVSDDGSSNSNGLGDISLLANYKLFSSFNLKKNKNFEQALWIGAGAKLATGRFDADIADPASVTPVDVNTQMGSGSNDFLLNTMYNVKWNKFGINTVATYKINTNNTSLYQFGNKGVFNTTAFYNIDKKDFIISPNVGLLYEVTNHNKHQGKAVENTNNHALMATTGLQIRYDRISIGVNFQMPIQQDFSDGQTTIKAKGTLQFTVAL